MKKIVSWLLGLSAGTAVGVLIVALFVPETSKQIRTRLRAGYEETMEAARLASENRRKELEQQLKDMQNRLPEGEKR